MTCIGYHLRRHPMSGEGWLEVQEEAWRAKVDAAGDYVRDCQTALDAHLAECQECTDIIGDYVDCGYSADLVSWEEICPEGCRLGKALDEAKAEHKVLSHRE